MPVHRGLPRVGCLLVDDLETRVTPAWFPIRRVSDDELEANEIDFQLRVNAVIEGRMTPQEAEKVRAEYQERRRLEKLRRDGVLATSEGRGSDKKALRERETPPEQLVNERKKGWFRRLFGSGNGGG